MSAIALIAERRPLPLALGQAVTRHSQPSRSPSRTTTPASSKSDRARSASANSLLFRNTRRAANCASTSVSSREPEAEHLVRARRPILRRSEA